MMVKECDGREGQVSHCPWSGDHDEAVTDLCHTPSLRDVTPTGGG